MHLNSLLNIICNNVTFPFATKPTNILRIDKRKKNMKNNESALTLWSKMRNLLTKHGKNGKRIHRKWNLWSVEGLFFYIIGRFLVLQAQSITGTLKHLAVSHGNFSNIGIKIKTHKIAAATERTTKAKKTQRTKTTVFISNHQVHGSKSKNESKFLFGFILIIDGLCVCIAIASV